jgi:hypothetical protein
MERSRIFVGAFFAIILGSAARAEQISVTHIQSPMHRFMAARLEDGKIIANGEFTQVVKGDEVTMRMIYRFLDGSIDDEKPVDFTVEADTSIATSRTTDRNGKVHVESEHIHLSDDVANGFVGTLLLNVPPNTAPFRVGMLAPFGGGRLIRLLISPEGEQPFQTGGQTLKATVFRIHPELGGIVGVIAQLIGLQPKDVMVWVLEGEQPAVVRIIGQLGGYGPVVSSELEGTSFRK